MAKAEKDTGPLKPVVEDLRNFIENDAESEIRRIFKERMGTENGWSDALSDVLTVIRDMFTDLTDNGGEQ